MWTLIADSFIMLFADVPSAPNAADWILAPFEANETLVAHLKK